MHGLIAFFASVAVFGFSEARPDPCSMPIEPGFCLAYIPSWGYDQSSDRCVEFIYGGCQGNLNRFGSREECEEVCGVSPAPAARSHCYQPTERGRCRAFMPSWGYDSELGRCRRFIYGGCGGNQNRFSSKHKCEMVCGK
ncbi:Kunitz-type U19-barytoxin-Tl1a [Taenia solium]|eukprot:TsM_000738200 transcript=TsM_000738200 gene=TsM_000738200